MSHRLSITLMNLILQKNMKK